MTYIWIVNIVNLWDWMCSFLHIYIYTKKATSKALSLKVLLYVEYIWDIKYIFLYMLVYIVQTFLNRWILTRMKSTFFLWSPKSELNFHISRSFFFFSLTYLKSLKIVTSSADSLNYLFKISKKSCYKNINIWCYYCKLV